MLHRKLHKLLQTLLRQQKDALSNPAGALQSYTGLGSLLSSLQGIPSSLGGQTIGSAGGAGGTGFAAPTSANIMSGTSAGQLGTAYAGAGNSLQSQQNLLAALQAQGSLGAQSNILGQQQALANQLGSYNGSANLNAAMSNQAAVAGQQQALANQYANIGLGQGPNPAQAMLNQTTGQNVANQAALMAGQRGANANVGLLARQAAQQGANTQQQAVGQGATMQAQQSLAALQNEAGQQQALGATNQNIAGIAEQQTAQTQAQQQAAAAQANTLAGQQVGQTNTAAQAQQAEQQILQNALAAQNQQNVAQQSNINTGNVTLANTAMQGQQKVTGGLLNAAGAAAGLTSGGSSLVGAGAEGGEVKKFADGGDTSDTIPTTPESSISSPPSPAPAPILQAPMAPGFIQGPQSSFGQFLVQNKQNQNTVTPTAEPSSTTQSKSSGANPAAQAALMAAMMAKGGKAHNLTDGGNVSAESPKEKAVKSGNSYDNDKIPAYLSEGEVVIPRSVMQGKDPARGAAEFVAKVMAKKRMGK